MKIRTKRKESFTTIQNRIVNDGDLKADTLGVLLWCLSKPDDWIYNLKTIRDRFGFGRDRVARIMCDLRNLGYAKCERSQNDFGHFSGTQYTVADTRVFRRSVKPTLGKSGPIIKTDKELKGIKIPKDEARADNEGLRIKIGGQHYACLFELGLDLSDPKVDAMTYFLKYLYCEKDTELGYDSMRELFAEVMTCDLKTIQEGIKFSIRSGYKALILNKQKKQSNDKRKSGKSISDIYQQRRATKDSGEN